jgi:hypothetical protein
MGCWPGSARAGSGPAGQRLGEHGCECHEAELDGHHVDEPHEPLVGGYHCGLLATTWQMSPGVLLRHGGGDVGPLVDDVVAYRREDQFSRRRWDAFDAPKRIGDSASSYVHG